MIFRGLNRRKVAVWVKKFQRLALETYNKTPRTTTFAILANEEGHSPVFCIKLEKVIDPQDKKETRVEKRKVFLVPRQISYTRKDREFGAFVCIKVLDPEQEHQPFWLISNCASRKGFLLPFDLIETRGRVRTPVSVPE